MLPHATVPLHQGWSRCLSHDALAQLTCLWRWGLFESFWCLCKSTWRKELASPMRRRQDQEPQPHTPAPRVIHDSTWHHSLGARTMQLCRPFGPAQWNTIRYVEALHILEAFIAAINLSAMTDRQNFVILPRMTSHVLIMQFCLPTNQSIMKSRRWDLSNPLNPTLGKMLYLMCWQHWIFYHVWVRHPTLCRNIMGIQEIEPFGHLLGCTPWLGHNDPVKSITFASVLRTLFVWSFQHNVKVIATS